MKSHTGTPEADNGTRPRVLFITRKWPPAVGGMETYSVELSRELERLVELETRVLPGRPDGRPPSMFALAGFLIGSAWFLATHRGRYDIVHFGDFVLFPLAWLHAMLDPRCKRTLTLHGLDLIYGNRQGIKPWLYRRFMNFARRRHAAVDLFLSNSSNTRMLAQQQGFERCRAIPLGVRMPAATPPDDGKKVASAPFVLFVGRLVTRKGAAWFAREVLPLLPEPIRMKVVGKVWDRQEGEQLQHNPRVDLLGYVSDSELQALRSTSIAVVMPNIPSPDQTDVEGFGITAVEAAASGAILVAARLEGITDAVRDGVTGFLLEPLDAQAWADKISELATWPGERRQAFLTGAQQLIRDYYAWSRVARDSVDAYGELLNRQIPLGEPG